MSTRRTTVTRKPQNFHRYSKTNPDLITVCPIPGCSRDFTVSRSRTPTRGVDISHYISHLNSGHCREQQIIANWDQLVQAVDTLPESYYSQSRNVVWDNKTISVEDMQEKTENDCILDSVYQLQSNDLLRYNYPTSLNIFLAISLACQIGIYYLY